MRLAALAVALLTAFASGWAVNGWRLGARHATALQSEIDARAKAEQTANAASEQLEANLFAIRGTTNQLNRRMARETTLPAYRCPVPAHGLRLRQAAVSGDPPGEPDRPLRDNP